MALNLGKLNLTKMLSRQFFVDINFVLKFSEYFNVSPIRLNKTNNLFQCDESPKIKAKMRINFFTLCLSFSAMIFVAFIRYKENNLDVMNQIFAFQFGSMIMLIVLSISTFFSNDVCFLLNGHIIYFRYLQRKT